MIKNELLLAHQPLIETNTSNLNDILEHILKKISLHDGQMLCFNENDKQMKRTQAELSALHSRLDQQHRLIESLCSDLQDRDDQLKALQEQYDSNNHSLEQRVTQVELSVAQILQQQHELDRNSGGGGGNNTISTELLESLKEKTDTLFENNDKTSQQLQLLQSRLNAHDHRISNLQALPSSINELRELLNQKADLRDLHRYVSSSSTRPSSSSSSSSATTTTNNMSLILERRLNAIEDRINSLVDGRDLLLKQHEQENEADFKMYNERILALERQFHDHDISKVATQVYCDRHYQDMVRRLEQGTSGVRKRMNTQLRLFEKDLQLYLDEVLENFQRERNANAHSTTAIGRTHFKCLTCNSTIEDMDETDGIYSIPKRNAPPQPHQPVSRLEFGGFLVDTGSASPITSSRGNVYKGRTTPRIMKSPRPTSSSNRNAAIPRITSGRRTTRPGSAPASKQSRRIAYT